MSLTAALIDFATSVIGSTGYLGVALLMALESMIAPIPSEAVMPFAGFLAYEGTFTLLGVVLASTAGSLAGSLLSYALGHYGGRFVVHRFGRYLLLREHHLTMTERFFARYGEKAVFWSRFIPVVRHLISIPAGIGEMRLGKFVMYTAIGAGLWNSFLAWLGLTLGANWELVHRYGRLVDALILAALLLAVVYLLRHVRRRRRARQLS